MNRTEWISRDGKFEVIHIGQGGTRHLMDKSKDFHVLAAQHGVKGTVEDWLAKKVADRIASTNEWIRKLQEQIAVREKELAVWESLRGQL